MSITNGAKHNADYYVNVWGSSYKLYSYVEHPTRYHADIAALEMRSVGWNNRIGVWHIKLKAKHND